MTCSRPLPKPGRMADFAALSEAGRIASRKATHQLAPLHTRSPGASPQVGRAEKELVRRGREVPSPLPPAWSLWLSRLPRRGARPLKERHESEPHERSEGREGVAGNGKPQLDKAHGRSTATRREGAADARIRSVPDSASNRDVVRYGCAVRCGALMLLLLLLMAMMPFLQTCC